jgi:hypothetical protein
MYSGVPVNVPDVGGDHASAYPVSGMYRGAVISTVSFSSDPPLAKPVTGPTSGLHMRR